jgi:hypothetical protein
MFKKARRIIFELYEHINYFPIAQIYKLFLGVSYVFLMSYVHCEQALRIMFDCIIPKQVFLSQYQLIN